MKNNYTPPEAQIHLAAMESFLCQSEVSGSGEGLNPWTGDSFEGIITGIDGLL